MKMTKSSDFEEYKRSKDIALRNRLVEENLFLVDILIRKYLNKGVEYDDLYQVGAMALVNAVDRFDPSKGYEFSSFATPTILGEIKKYFRDKEWSLKVPRRLKEISSKIPSAREYLEEKLQRTPTVVELAEYLGHTESEIFQAIESGRAYGTYSLNQTFDDAGEEGEGLVLEKYTMVEDKGYEVLEYSEIINTVLKKLSPTEKYVFEKRFIENQTQVETAKALSISQMTVSRIERGVRTKFKEEVRR